ncbi:MAG TPA: 23S rRNA (cytosine(1962)-C(5))-methyltransferase RlmI, partial [Thermoanaerobaculia bacterium]|nr:23S rRNA (cytosine(1962)-C(5))-methyltransferase RlmI [Thermoanaerobaculia bacterium]
MFDRASRRRIVLRPGREKSLRNRHPWVFDGAIAREEGPREAALADAIDARGNHLASGFYSAHSQIRLRAIAFGEDELTEALLRGRIVAAVARRASILDGETTACRLIHSEGDDLSGLIVDRYGDALAISTPVKSLWVFRDKVEASPEQLRALTGARSVYIKNDLPARKLEHLPLEDRIVGETPREETIRENGLS